MKKVSKILGLLLLVTIVIFQSCSKEEDKPTPTPDNEKFTGTYNVTENCDGDIYSFSMTITASGTSALLINNFNDDFYNVNANVSGSTFTMPVQDMIVDDETYRLTSGSGTLSGTTLTMNYQIYDVEEEYTDNCNCTATKQ